MQFKNSNFLYLFTLKYSYTNNFFPGINYLINWMPVLLWSILRVVGALEAAGDVR